MPVPLPTQPVITIISIISVISTITTILVSVVVIILGGASDGSDRGQQIVLCLHWVCNL